MALWHVLMILGCAILYGGWKLDATENINGIVAVKDDCSDVLVKYGAPGIDLDTPFLIGSLTKQFTGILAFQHLGEVIDRDVGELLDEEEFQSLLSDRAEWEKNSLWPELTLSHLSGVTVKQLLHHRSKIDYFTGESLDEYRYQNLNFDLVGRVLEKRTGKTYEELARELFQAAEMTGTFLGTDFPEREFLDKLKNSLIMVNRSPMLMKNPLTRGMNASGGIISTAHDLLKWNEFLAVNGYFGKLSEFIANCYGNEYYGYGVVTDAKKNCFFHTGGLFLDDVPCPRAESSLDVAVLETGDGHSGGVLCVSFLLYDLETRFSAVGFDIIGNVPAPRYQLMFPVGQLIMREIDEKIGQLLLRSVLP